MNRYKAWQSAALGRDIDPSRLVAYMVNAGATKVQIRQPQQADVAPDAVANCTGTDIIFGGYLMND